MRAKRERVRHGDSNRFAIRTLEETAQIMFAEGLLPSPSKQNVLNLERRAFAKIRAACAELEDYLLDDRSDVREEQRGRFLAARGA
jgi:hypothetical protein